MTVNSFLRAVSGLAGAMAALTGVPAHAQQSVVPQDAAKVQGGDGSGNNGRIAFNVAAGSLNQQLSSAILARGDLAVATEAVSQSQHSAAGEDRATSVEIMDGAFANNSGLISINVAAGSQNQSANLAMLAIGTSGAISDQLLEQSRAPIEPSGGTEPGLVETNDSVAVGNGAFGDGSGLIQVNLIGGERNSSANTFSLSISAEGQP